MLKLVKYEFRKNRTFLLILLGACIVLEGYFLISKQVHHETHLVVSAVLLAIAAFAVGICLFAVGIASYTNELKQKSSYLIFMTPNSGRKIIASKILYTLFLGLAFTALLCWFFTMDYSMFMEEFDAEHQYRGILEFLMLNQGMNIGQTLLTTAGMILSGLLEVLSIVGVIYFAVTLSSTVLQNKKGKGIVSLLLVVAFIFGLSKLSGLYWDGNATFDTIMDVVKMLIPDAVQSAVVLTASIFGSAYLLDKHVSL